MSHGKIAEVKFTIYWKTDLKWTLSSKQASTLNWEEKQE